MACRGCKSSLDLLAGLLGPAPTRRASNALFRRSKASRLLPAQSRSFHRSQPRCDRNEQQPPIPAPAEEAKAGVVGSISGAAARILQRTAEPYRVYGITDQIYKTCSKQAAYSISPEDRKKGTVATTEDGEEIGSGGGMWHDDFNLPASFSTWSQVTMLHMYLIVTRLRCLDKEGFLHWQAQLVDHFFHEAEEKMDVVHNITSGSIRQRYLRDLFHEWRGVILAYDEGVIKGDAVLAAAVWRNLFKASEDVDLRVLASIVSWMRHCQRTLDQMEDASLMFHGTSAFKLPAKSELPLVDMPSPGLEGSLAALLQSKAAATPA